MQPTKNTINLRAYAKLNLFLNIVGVNEKNYHLLEMIMQSISLYDEVLLEFDKTNLLEVKCKCIDDSAQLLPQGEQNIAHKAAERFLEALAQSNPECLKQYSGCKISIIKNIPSCAGMAGGSADAAAVLHGFNKFFKSPFSLETLQKIGESIGADVPFCLLGGTAKVEGIGEIISPIECGLDCFVVISKPLAGISTKSAFNTYDKLSKDATHDLTSSRESIDNLKKAIEIYSQTKKLHSFTKLCKMMHNTFLEYASNVEIDDTLKRLSQMGCGGKTAMMTGSGSAVFGLFQTKEKAHHAYDLISNNFPNNVNLMCKTMKTGVDFISIPDNFPLIFHKNDL